MENVGLAPRASFARSAWDVVNGRVIEPQRDELRADRTPKVNVRLSLARAVVPDLRLRRSRMGDTRGHLGADLETARADTRSYGRDEATALTKRPKGGANDTRDDPAPTRMNRGDASTFGVGDEHGYAIRHAHGHSIARARLGHEGIRFDT